MKTIKTTKTIEQEVITYEAVDGTVFESADACKEYEKTAECVIKARYVKAFGQAKTASTGEDLRSLHNCSLYVCNGGSDDDYTFALTFHTQEELDAFFMYTKLKGNDFTDTSYRNCHFEVGKTYLFSGYDCNEFYCLGEAEELKRRAVMSIDVVANDWGCKDCKHCNLEDKHCYNEIVYCGKPENRNMYNVVDGEDRFACNHFDKREDK